MEGVCTWICVMMWGAPSQGWGRVQRGEVLVMGRVGWVGGEGPWGQSCGNELLVSEEDELYYGNAELLFWGLIWGTAAGSPSHAAQHRYTLSPLTTCWMSKRKRTAERARSRKIKSAKCSRRVVKKSPWHSSVSSGDVRFRTTRAGVWGSCFLHSNQFSSVWSWKEIDHETASQQVSRSAGRGREAKRLLLTFAHHFRSSSGRKQHCLSTSRLTCQYIVRWGGGRNDLHDLNVFLRPRVTNCDFIVCKTYAFTGKKDLMICATE